MSILLFLCPRSMQRVSTKKFVFYEACGEAVSRAPLLGHAHERNSTPYGVQHGGLRVADLVLKLQLIFFWPDATTKQPAGSGHARAPVDLKPRARHAWLQSFSETSAMPCSAHVVEEGTSV